LLWLFCSGCPVLTLLSWLFSPCCIYTYSYWNMSTKNKGHGSMSTKIRIARAWKCKGKSPKLKVQKKEPESLSAKGFYLGAGKYKCEDLKKPCPAVQMVERPDRWID
jgi:hypothetical protein